MTVYIFRSFLKVRGTMPCVSTALSTNRPQPAFQPQPQPQPRAIAEVSVAHHYPKPWWTQFQGGRTICLRLSPLGLCSRDLGTRAGNAPSPLCLNNRGHLPITQKKMLVKCCLIESHASHCNLPTGAEMTGDPHFALFCLKRYMCLLVCFFPQS